ncbi:MAG: chromate transporter [Ruminococcus sp.]|nr:chromate transporter [Ruminococcus sp.]
MIYPELFLTFFLIGMFTFGGGYAMLPLIQEQVLAKEWVTDAQIVDFIAVSESTPGPFAVNISTYVGIQTGGILGGICATLGVVLPSFIVILIVAKCFDRFRNSKAVSGCMSGLKPAVIGMIGSAVVSVGMTVFFPAGFNSAVFSNLSFYLSLIMFVGAVILAFRKAHPVLIIALSATLGIVAGYAGLLP